MAYHVTEQTATTCAEELLRRPWTWFEGTGHAAMALKGCWVLGVWVLGVWVKGVWLQGRGITPTLVKLPLPEAVAHFAETPRVS